MMENFVIDTISNGNRTEWSPIQSVIIRVIKKLDDRAAGVRFVDHEYEIVIVIGPSGVQFGE